MNKNLYGYNKNVKEDPKLGYMKYMKNNFYLVSFQSAWVI